MAVLSNRVAFRHIAYLVLYGSITTTGGTSAGAMEYPVAAIPSSSLPRIWKSSEMPVVIEVALATPSLVERVSVLSDWWMKRPDEIKINLIGIGTEGSYVTLSSQSAVFPKSRNICGSTGDLRCSFPGPGPSMHTVDVSSPSVSLVQIVLVSALNSPGKPNDYVIIKDVIVDSPSVYNPATTSTTTMSIKGPDMLTTTTELQATKPTVLPVHVLPKTWKSSEVPITIEVALSSPAVVSSISVVSDWWMKRPKELEIKFLGEGFAGSLDTLAVIYSEYPRSRNICGPNGNLQCNYPHTPTSMHTLDVSFSFLVKLVQVSVLTPLNEPGQPNCHVIMKDVLVSTRDETSMQTTSLSPTPSPAPSPESSIETEFPFSPSPFPLPETVLEAFIPDTAPSTSPVYTTHIPAIGFLSVASTTEGMPHGQAANVEAVAGTASTTALTIEHMPTTRGEFYSSSPAAVPEGFGPETTSSTSPVNTKRIPAAIDFLSPASTTEGLPHGQTANSESAAAIASTTVLTIENMPTAHSEFSSSGQAVEADAIRANADNVQTVVEHHINFDRLGYANTLELTNAIRSAVVKATSAVGTTLDDVAVSIKSIIVSTTYTVDDSLTTSQVGQAIAHMHGVSVSQVTISMDRRLLEDGDRFKQQYDQGRRLVQNVHAEVEIVPGLDEDFIANAKAVHAVAANSAALAASLSTIVGSGLLEPMVVSAPVAKVTLQSFVSTAQEYSGSHLNTSSIHDAVGTSVTQIESSAHEAGQDIPSHRERSETRLGMLPGTVLFEIFDVDHSCGQWLNLSQEKLIHCEHLLGVDFFQSSIMGEDIFSFLNHPWIARFSAALDVTAGGDYTFVLSAGHANASTLLVDGIELVSSQCSNDSENLVTSLQLSEGLHSIQMINGWIDDVMLSYQGVDTNGKLVQVPPDRLLPNSALEPQPKWDAHGNSTIATYVADLEQNSFSANSTTAMYGDDFEESSLSVNDFQLSSYVMCMMWCVVAMEFCL